MISAEKRDGGVPGVELITNYQVMITSVCITIMGLNPSIISGHAADRKCSILIATNGILIILQTAATNISMKRTGTHMKEMMHFTTLLI